jgi:hypothetical protein
VWVELGGAGLDDERVPVAYFEEFPASGMIEGVAPGE